MLLSVGLLVGLLVGGGAGVIAVPSVTTVTVCADKTTNVLRYATNNRCSTTETKVLLNTRGATGPIGVPGSRGATGFTGSRGLPGMSYVANYQVSNSGSSSWEIDNVSGDPTLTLVRNQTYFFTVNASGHPFQLQTTSGAYNSSNSFSSGVVGSGTQSGGITFSVPVGAPSTLYYVCQFHQSMNGTINIIG